MESGTSRCWNILGALAISLALLAPCMAVAERNVDSALRKASQAGDLTEMQHQLELGAEPNQAYALVAAVQGNQLAAVKYLLAHGADPNAWTRINLRVPEGAAYSPMFVAASQGNREILGYLKRHGADVNAEWTREGDISQTALGASILAGDLRGTQLLIESGANVNLVPKRGDLPLIQTVFAPKNKVELAQLLLSHGADPDIKNAEGVTPRRQSRGYVTLKASIDQAKPLSATSATQLEPEDVLEVAMALHYKALCDVALPGYPAQVADDYSRWRTSQAKALSQLEASPEFQTQQAGAKAAFDQARAELSGDELQQQMQTLHRICEVALVDQFRTGTPVVEAGTGAAPPIDIIKSAPATVTTSVTVHKKAAPVAVAGGMASHP